MSPGLDGLTCALFLVTAFVLAGLGQTVWLATDVSRRWASPLDGGRTFRGRRLFGDNKTWRGFVIMVPAVGASFALLAALARQMPAVASGLWPLSVGGYASLGLFAGFGFMAGELPNSFLKRQLGVPAGQAADGSIAQPAFFLLDRLDSPLGMMLTLSLFVPVPAATWLWVLLVGPVLHGLFSVLVFQLGGKARAA